MLFSSYQFVFVFLPATAAVYALLARRQAWGLAWLIACSVAFYAMWRPANVLVMAPSIAVNYAAIQLIVRTREGEPRVARAAFWAAVAFNLCFLGWFKYSAFAVQVADDLTGAGLAWGAVALPLGISFITFQKVALLVDMESGAVGSVGLRDYALFVLFFPQLVAGPIVHFRELMPQFAEGRRGATAEDVAVGVTLFSAGLAKKACLADPLATLTSPLWAQAAAGGHPALLQAWAAALGYLVQLYFDFSGYSDMAVGAARLFGVRLPPNFDSPLKATSIIDFWSRWHMTLTRFLTSYVFTPMTLRVMRRRVASGRPVKVRGHMTPGGFASMVGVPVMSTMLLSGVWHGAGYQFLAFGAAHGAALTANHAWRAWRSPASARRSAGLSGWAATFLFVACAEVAFRAPDLGTAWRVLAGMGWANGLELPDAAAALRASLAAVGVHAQATAWGGADFLWTWSRIASGLAIALLAPNVLEVMRDHDPALGFRARRRPGGRPRRLTWRPDAKWAVATAAVSVAGMSCLGHLGEFLYWKF